MFNWLDVMEKEIKEKNKKDNNNTEIKISEDDLNRIADTVITKLSSSTSKPNDEDEKPKDESEKLKDDDNTSNDDNANNGNHE